jgi:hypothetical protein
MAARTTITTSLRCAPRAIAGFITAPTVMQRRLEAQALDARDLNERGEGRAGPTRDETLASVEAAGSAVAR